MGVLVKGLGRLLLYTALWGLSGAAVGFGLANWFALNWILPCMWLNIVAGLIMLQLMFQNPELNELFSEGPFEGRPGSILIGLLWSLPLVMFFIGFLWWLMGQLFK